MGEATISNGIITIHSHIIIYGDGATQQLTEQLREEIEMAWNEPEGRILLNSALCKVAFHITAQLHNGINALEIYQNTDPRNNFFRIEEFAWGNISFVDGLGCNSGYFKLENLYRGSTTAAHEYGHTLGLDHPKDLDIRGKGVPGIMYPRGTWVDPTYQYDPSKPAGVTGGTMHPMHRKVRQKDIDDLKLHRLRFQNGKAVVGAFTNVYHHNHALLSPDDLAMSPIAG